MAMYGAGFTKTAPTVGTMIAQLRTAATRDVRVFEIGLFATTAVTADVGLIRASTVGATFTSVTPQAEDASASAAVTLVDTAATTAPTIGTNYLRRIQIPATIGAGIVWTFPRGLVIPISAGLLLWNVTGTGPALSGYFSYEE